MADDINKIVERLKIKLPKAPSHLELASRPPRQIMLSLSELAEVKSNDARKALQEEIAELTKKISKQPTKVIKPYVKRSACYAKLRWIDMAMTDAQQACDLAQGQHPQPLIHLAKLHLLQIQILEAESILTRRKTRPSEVELALQEMRMDILEVIFQIPSSAAVELVEYKLMDSVLAYADYLVPEPTWMQPEPHNPFKEILKSLSGPIGKMSDAHPKRVTNPYHGSIRSSRDDSDSDKSISPIPLEPDWTHASLPYSHTGVPSTCYLPYQPHPLPAIPSIAVYHYYGGHCPPQHPTARYNIPPPAPRTPLSPQDNANPYKRKTSDYGEDLFSSLYTKRNKLEDLERQYELKLQDSVLPKRQEKKIIPHPTTTSTQSEPKKDLRQVILARMPPANQLDLHFPFKVNLPANFSGTSGERTLKHNVKLDAARLWVSDTSGLQIYFNFIWKRYLLVCHPNEQRATVKCPFKDCHTMLAASGDQSTELAHFITCSNRGNNRRDVGIHFYCRNSLECSLYFPNASQLKYHETRTCQLKHSATSSMKQPQPCPQPPLKLPQHSQPPRPIQHPQKPRPQQQVKPLAATFVHQVPVASSSNGRALSKGQRKRQRKAALKQVHLQLEKGLPATVMNNNYRDLDQLAARRVMQPTSSGRVMQAAGRVMPPSARLISPPSGRVMPAAAATRVMPSGGRSMPAGTGMAKLLFK